MTFKALLLAPLLAAAIVVPGGDWAGFVSGVWRGEANYDLNGKFRDCTMTAEAESGVLLGFVISKDFDWGLVIADEGRDLVVGSSQAVVLIVDARAPIPAVAKVVDQHGILIPLDNSDDVVEAMRQGRTLTVASPEMQFSFELTGTNDAIAALSACVTEHLGTEPA